MMKKRSTEKRWMKKGWRLLLCCCAAWVALALPALAAQEIAGPPATNPPKPAENAAGMPLVPDFTLPSAAGGEVSLSDYAGKQVVLYFWASWCTYCKKGFPEKQALHDWMLETGFPGAVLAINVTDGVEETRQRSDAYIAEQGFTMPVLYDERGDVTDLFVASGIPVTVVIDAEGYLKGGAVGVQPMQDTKALLERQD